MEIIHVLVLVCRYEQPTVKGLQEDNLGNKMLKVQILQSYYMYIHITRDSVSSLKIHVRPINVHVHVSLAAWWS